jgi:hypothetical protein
MGDQVLCVAVHGDGALAGQVSPWFEKSFESFFRFIEILFDEKRRLSFDS